MRQSEKEIKQKGKPAKYYTVKYVDCFDMGLKTMLKKIFINFKKFSLILKILDYTITITK